MTPGKQVMVFLQLLFHQVAAIMFILNLTKDLFYDIFGGN